MKIQSLSWLAEFRGHTNGARWLGELKKISQDYHRTYYYFICRYFTSDRKFWNISQFFSIRESRLKVVRRVLRVRIIRVLEVDKVNAIDSPSFQVSENWKNKLALVSPPPKMLWPGQRIDPPPNNPPLLYWNLQSQFSPIRLQQISQFWN